MDKLAQETSNHEHLVWDAIYQKQLANPQIEEFSSYWWEYYYYQMNTCVRAFFSEEKLNNVRVLEVGSGTGKATLLTVPEAKITFFDLSSRGLEIAQLLSKQYSAKQTEYVQGNMFNLPFKDDSFDFAWNIGTIEHYSPEHVKMAIVEMLRVLAKGGRIAIAVPNYYSLPMLKARLLGHQKWGKYLKWIPGYRADSEMHYTSKQLLELIKEASNDCSFTLKDSAVHWIGSPFFVGSNKLLVSSFHFLENMFPRTKFLVLVTGIKS